MLIPETTKKMPKPFSPTLRENDVSSELKFITELGRSLLFTVHPKKVALRVADAIREKTDAEICAVVVELQQIGLVSGIFTSENGESSQNLLDRGEFKEWVEILPPQVSYLKAE